jgi:ferredoxin
MTVFDNTTDANVDEMTDDETAGGGRVVRIEANRDICAGSALCEHIAGRHLQVSGGVVEVLEGDVAPEDLPAILEAVDSCPTQALSIRSVP